MYVYYGTFELFLPYCTSLKEKRKIINSIIDKLRKRLNLSISEVEFHDLWQRSSIGFAVVAASHLEAERFTNYVKDTLFNYASDVEITRITHHIISLSEE